MRREQLSVNELTVNKIIGGNLNIGAGEIFYASVVKTVREWLEQRTESEHVFSTIAAAAAKAVSYRNDYVIVADGPYGIATTIDLSSLNSVHIVGASGYGVGCGCPGGAYIVQTAAYPAITLGNWCEIAGLQIWNYTGEEAVYGTLKQGNHVHHNLIRMTAAAGICSGIDLAGGYGNNYNRVEFNKLIHYAGVAGAYCINVGLGTGNDTCDNEVVVFGGCTYDIGILNQSPGGLCDRNRVSDCGGSGTITIAIQIRTANGNSAIDNRLAVPTTQGLAGGTAERSFVQNFDAAGGGATAIQT